MEMLFKIIGIFTLIVVAAYIVAGVTLFVLAILGGLQDEKNENL